MLETITLLLALSALFSFFNERYLNFPLTIGLMFQAFIFSLSLTILGIFYPEFLNSNFMKSIMEIDFSQFVLQGVLCFLLFAGAKNLSLKELNIYKWDIITLALLTTFLAVFIIGGFVYVLFLCFGFPLNFLHALIFGAIIAPTDPIASLAILKSMGLPENIEAIIDGESQFNDGVGVVIFVTLLAISSGDSSPQLSYVFLAFSKSVFGGIGLGLLMAFFTHYLVLNSKTTLTQILITLSSVSMTYTLAEITGVSGPIGSVVLGICFGNLTLTQEKVKKIRQHVNLFWELISQVLNAVLFVLIGLVALQVHINNILVLISMIVAIVVVLMGRFLSVYISMALLQLEHKFHFTSHLSISGLLTWAGLRGALAVALVLALPDEPYKSMLIPMVYGVVIFSILIQAGTIRKLYSKQDLINMLQIKRNDGSK